MNQEDYDNDGNNIVPCQLCLSVYCKSKENGKCPEEDKYVKDMNQKQSWEEDFLKDYEFKNGSFLTEAQVRERKYILSCIEKAIQTREREISDWLYTLKAEGENEDEKAGFSKAIDMVYLSIINNKSL